MKGHYRSVADDPERCEYFVPMEWLATRPLSQAVNETGMFGNQNTVCAPRTPEMAPYGGAAEGAVSGMG